MEKKGIIGDFSRVEISNSLKERLEEIVSRFFEKGSKYLIAYSGGVDSTLLTYVCKIFGLDYSAVTVKSEVLSKKEFKDAVRIAGMYGFNHKVLNLNLLQFQEFVENDNLRCYFCKKKILEAIKELDKDAVILDGTNSDDLNDFRPGLKASKEMGVLNPLRELSKGEIREISKELGLDTWKKPSNSCLATRILEGKIEKGKLEKIELAEEILHDIGFKLVRVRVRQVEKGGFSGNCESLIGLNSNPGLIYKDKVLMVTVQVAVNKLQKLEDLKSELMLKLKGLGFQRVSFDPEGYPSDEIE